jgi:hypothetical protein
MLTLHLRQQQLAYPAGYATWQRVESVRQLDSAQTALLLCDVWDHHWCRGAVERLDQLLPRMSHVVNCARERGLLIVHAPSDVMAFYSGAPARQRALAAPPVEPPPDLPHADPPLPVDASDGGGDTTGDFGAVDEIVWTRQHPAIEIDQARDVISADGRELYSLYAQRGIRFVIILGVHANMCILNRSFAIKQLVRWGIDVALVRDLTDSMYNPARPPYVDHDEGTRLVTEYIEKFWCPTIGSEDLA